MPLSSGLKVMGRFVVAVSLGVVLGLMGCLSPKLPAATSAPSPSSEDVPSLMPTADMTSSQPDVLLRPAQSGQTISVSVGQMIGVSPPSLAVKWHVTYASEVLESLTPPEKFQAPGPDGWLFRAIAPGKTDLLLTSIVEACSTNTPCPPISARFVFTIEVK